MRTEGFCAFIQDPTRGWLRSSGAVLVALALGCSADAFAQSAAERPALGALDQLELAPPGDALVTIASPGDPGFLRPRFGSYFSFAYQPLVLADVTGEVKAVVVNHQLLLHLQAALGIIDRLTVDVDAPFTLSQSGDGMGGAQYPSPKGADVDDVRLGLSGVLYKQKQAMPTLAARVDLWCPSGNATKFDGASVVRFGPEIDIGADYHKVVWGASLSARFQPAVANALIGSQVRLGAGVLGRVAFLELGPELNLTIAADAAAHPFDARTVGFEALAVARAAVGPVKFSLAGGPGVGHAPGMPEARVLAGVSVAFDAIKTPAAWKEKEEGADLRVAGGSGPSAGSAPKAGQTGPTTAGAETHPEAQPKVTPKPVDVPRPTESSGSVRLTENQIVILEQVHFKTGSAEIDASSFGLLGEVAEVLNKHPDIARVAVDGHTDNDGPAERNLQLSRQRAMAVVRWLIEHGVDSRRTEARGFGARQPLADNSTPEGRAKNRRVEFIILRATLEGNGGWEDGTIVPNITPKPSESGKP